MRGVVVVLTWLRRWGGGKEGGSVVGFGGVGWFGTSGVGLGGGEGLWGERVEGGRLDWRGWR